MLYRIFWQGLDPCQGWKVEAMTEVLNTLCENVLEMWLLVEGALALFEDEWDGDLKETADLMGEALYMLRERLRICQRALKDHAKGQESSVKNTLFLIHAPARGAT